MTALILQARLDSSRLPGKAMLPLGGRPIIYRIMEAFRYLQCDEKILACSEDSARAFAPLADEAGFKMIPGPKDDVLSRFCIVIRQIGADRIIRATGDNPFVFVDAAVALNREAVETGADYAGYSGIPVGAGVESVDSAALLKAEKEAVDISEREHVCPYLYKHPEYFKLHRPLAPSIWQGENLRLTVDTKTDYERAEALYDVLCGFAPNERNFGVNIIKSAKKVFGS